MNHGYFNEIALFCFYFVLSCNIIPSFLIILFIRFFLFIIVIFWPSDLRLFTEFKVKA